MTSKNENPRKSPKDPPMAPIISLVSYTRTSVSTLLTLFHNIYFRTIKWTEGPLKNLLIKPYRKLLLHNNLSIFIKI